MNARTIAKLLRLGTDSQIQIASGDLLCGSVPAAQLAAQPAGSSPPGTNILQTGITPREMGAHPFHYTVLQFTNQLMTITDALTYASLEVYDFPKGLVTFLGATIDFTATTTTSIASTLNSGVTVQYGVGTAAASATTLATTMINVNPGTAQSVPTFTSSTTINVANTAASSVLKAVSTPIDGTATANKLYFNVCVTTNTDIDADAIVSLNGTLCFAWIFGGTVGLTFTP